MIPHSSHLPRFSSRLAPVHGRVPFAFATKAKLKIWWQTGFPIVLGIAPPGALGSIDSMVDLDGAFHGKTVWINGAVFSRPHSQEIADWIIAHEILHAKIAIIRMQVHSPLGRYRYGILGKAAAEALDLAYHDPDFAELAEILRKYRKSGFDEGEEALVRVVQAVLEGQDLPQGRALKKAVKMLGRPWGMNPANMVRIALSLPICGWTARNPRL